MKTLLLRYLYILPAILLFFISKSYGQDQPGLSASHSVVKFNELTYDFGEKALGADVTHKFEFRNVSNNRICITEVKASCGCTTPQYSTEPIKPGKKGVITVKYDSKRPGIFLKTLTVNINDGEQVILTIKGDIKNPNVGVALPK